MCDRHPDRLLAALPYAGILLARQGSLEDLARGFNSRQTDVDAAYLATVFLVLIGLLLAVWLLAKLLEQFDGQRPVDSSLLLFVSLSRVHGLGWREGWLLWRLARSQKLDEPARLFLEPERLNPANLPHALRRRAAELEVIGRRVFAGMQKEG